MEVILLKDVTDLGKQGEVVSVEHGYARDHLLPKGAAVVVTKTAEVEGGKVKFVVMGRKSGRFAEGRRRRFAPVRIVDRRAPVGTRVVGPIAHELRENVNIAREAEVEDFGNNGLQPVLEQLRTVRAEVHEGYSDVARRELTWRSFQQLATGPLWTAVEHLEDDPYRQQLADVLDAAVGGLEAFQLDERHFAAIDSTLSRLSAPTVTEDAVDACENEWQAAEVATVPALRAAFEEWLATSYPGIEDGG